MVLSRCSATISSLGILGSVCIGLFVKYFLWYISKVFFFSWKYQFFPSIGKSGMYPSWDSCFPVIWIVRKLKLEYSCDTQRIFLWLVPLTSNISFNTQFNVSIIGHKRSVSSLSIVLSILIFVSAILSWILSSRFDSSSRIWRLIQSYRCNHCSTAGRVRVTLVLWEGTIRIIIL